MYRPSNSHPSLATLYVDVDAYVAGNPGLPQDSVRAAATIHNAALDLARGAGDFAASYEQVDPQAPTPYDPGPTAVAVDDITGALATAYGPADRPSAELVRDRLVRLAQIDPAHPMAANWRILRDRCYPYAESITDWPEVEQAISAGLDAQRSAATEAQWQEDARLARESEAARLADLEAKAKHDEEFRAASLQGAPSGYRGDDSASIVTTSD